MPIALDHLRTLITVVDEGSFDAAATRLRVTPSAVSQRVKAMERAAGAALLRRTSPIVPTERGQSMLRQARQIAVLSDELEADLGRAAGADGPGGAPVLALAVNADSLATWFLPALARAHRELEVMFDIHREDQDHTVDLLRSGVVLGAVTALRAPVQGCTVVPLGAMRYRAVAAPTMRDRWMPDGTFRGLDTAPLVDFDRKDDLQQAFLRDLLGHPLRPPRHLIPTSADFERALVAGMGWGLLPDLQSAGHLRAGRLVELAPERPVDVVLHWQCWNLRSRRLDALTRIVRDAAAAALAPGG